MDRIIRQIIALINSNVKVARGIKKVYWGDPFFIPRSSLPAIAVNPNRTVVDLADTERDNDNIIIDIALILDARDSFNASGTEETVMYEATKIMEERESGTSHEVKDNTVLGIIRKDLWADTDFVLRTTGTQIDYGFRETREFPTVEAVLTLTAQSKIYTRS